MTQYIDKNRVEEILRNLWKEDDGHNAEHRICYNKALQEVQYKLDTLEVKEVEEEDVSEDLEKAARDILDTYKPIFSSSTSDGEPIEYYSPGQMRTIFMKGSYWQKEHCLKGLMTSDLETSADKYAIKIYNMFIKDETTLNNKEGDEILSDAFKAGAQWQKEHLWKPADGDDLPDIDREIIVLYQRYPLENSEYAVGFGHRPKEYWDGRNIETDKVTRYYPKRYDKGGWNIPDVKFWLDCNLPKMEELIMTQDEKSILLKDLCARLPYRVKCFVPIENLTMELTGKRLNYFCFHKEEWGFDYSHEFEVVLDPLNDARNGYVIKPYLRPISSMTEEEKEEMKQVSKEYLDAWENTKTPIDKWKLDAKVSYKRAVFYNSHHLDWNDLISKGLAIAVTEENNPYKE